MPRWPVGVNVVAAVEVDVREDGWGEPSEVEVFELAAGGAFAFAFDDWCI